jgi:putative peptidoglycan lipid II flippase
MNPIRLISGFFTVGAWTLLSRIFGLVRDVLVAAYLGSGPAAQAFVVAFTLPNLFRRFFAEGAFNLAFIPMFARRVETGDDPRGFAQDAYAALASVLIVLTLVAMAAMPWLVWAMASGFHGDERFDLAVVYGRIGFVYILFISLTALLSGILNALGRFAVAAAAPALLNVIFVLALLLGHAMGWDIGLTLSWAVPVAGVAQFAVLWVAAARAGFALHLALPRLTPAMRRLAVVAAPAVLAGGVVQINLVVGRQVASYTEGAVVWLFNADRLYQLPLGVVGIAIGIVLLPELSRRLGAGDIEGGRHSLNRATEFALALTLPAAVALAVIAWPIIHVLYGRGAYGAQDVTNTALALAIYGLGLPAFVLQKVWQPLFYAREDTRRPLNYAVLSMVVNAVVAIGLMPVIGFLAAAWATTLAAWVMVAQLWWGSRSMGQAVQVDARLRSRFWRIVLASAIMGAVLFGLHQLLAGMLVAGATRYLALLLLVAVGIATYFGTGFAIGALDWADFRSALRRKRATPAP